MAFATSGDVATVLGRSLTSPESAQVSSLLDRASDQIVGYGVPPDVDDSLGAVKRVCAEMVAAVFLKPSINVADYDATGYRSAPETTAIRVGVESATSVGPWLTNTQKRCLTPYRTGGMNQIGMKSESDRSRDVWPSLDSLYDADLI